MGFQWRVISIVLYVEMSFTVLLLFPGIPSKVWCFFLTSSLFQWIVGITKIFYWSGIFTLTVVFGDAVWRYRTCRSRLPTKITNAQQVLILSTLAEMIQAQRNLYISGFVLLLAFVNNRLVNLLIHTAQETHVDIYTHGNWLH